MCWPNECQRMWLRGARKASVMPFPKMGSHELASLRMSGPMTSPCGPAFWDPFRSGAIVLIGIALDETLVSNPANRLLINEIKS
jgi:hypothetical protein